MEVYQVTLKIIPLAGINIKILCSRYNRDLGQDGMIVFENYKFILIKKKKLQSKQYTGFNNNLNY